MSKLFTDYGYYTNKEIQAYINNKYYDTYDFDVDKLKQCIAGVTYDFETYAKDLVQENGEASKDEFEKSVAELNDCATKMNETGITKIKYDETDRNNIKNLITDGDDIYKEIMANLIVDYENLQLITEVQWLEIANKYLVDKDINALYGQEIQADRFEDYQDLFKVFIETAYEVLKSKAEDYEMLYFMNSYIEDAQEIINREITTSKDAIDENSTFIVRIIWSDKFSKLQNQAIDRSKDNCKDCEIFKNFKYVLRKLEETEYFISSYDGCKDIVNDRRELFNKVNEKKY